MKKLFFLFAALLFSVQLVAQAAPTVTIAAVPMNGTSPMPVTLTWSSTEVTTCTASGGWSGAKGTSGTEVIPGLLVNTTFTLTCTGASGQAILSWTPPTQNTDGTPLTNLAGYKLYHAPSSGNVAAATPISIPAPAATYTITGLPAGARFYGIKSSNSLGVDSDMSSLVTNTVAIPSASASISVVVNKKPNTVTGFSVQ